MIFLARLLDAEEMHEIRLLKEITSEDGLYAGALEVAKTLMEHAPLTLGTTKQALNSIVRHWTPAAAHEHVVKTYTSADFKEGIESFLAKRKPKWRGR
jgi:enoyl-CoA hydratase/carnithine racemase